MKRLIYSVLALAAMAFAFPSCNDDAPEEVQMTFTASVPGYDMQSRTEGTSSIGDGSKVDKVKCEVHELINNEYVKRAQERLTLTTNENGVKTTTYSPTLLKGRTYAVVFWAYKDGAYTVDDLTNVTRAKIGEQLLCNDDDLDAFAWVAKDVKAESATTVSVTLKRPLAQLNFGTNDVEAGLKMLETGAQLSGSSITVNAYSGYNVLTGDVVGNATPTTFHKKETPSGTLTANNIDYTNHLAMTYLFVGQDLGSNGTDTQSSYISDCSLTVYYTYTEGEETKEEVVNTTNYSNVNFKQNTRTNVISNNLLTGTINYTISLDNDFASFDDDNEINGEFPKQDGNGSSSN